MEMPNLFQILAVFLVMVKSQENPVVSMHPSFQQVYSGDTFKLSCDKSTGTVKWFFNSKEVKEQFNQTWNVAAVFTKTSGSYECESNGQKSNSVHISVLECLPPASLIIKSGMPVVTTDGSVILELQVDDGLAGWRCWVSRGIKDSKLTLNKKLATANHTSIAFQSLRQKEAVAIYWCSNTTNQRSSPVSIWRSDKMVVMDIQPRPAVLGKKLILNCEVMWPSSISNTVFYKDDSIIKQGPDSSHVIHNVTESDLGKYHCTATYILKDSSSRIPATVTSDRQELFAKAPPPKAVFSADMTCSCSGCPGDTSFWWYYKQSDQPWKFKSKGKSYSGDWSAGLYACRAVWQFGRSEISDIQYWEGDKGSNNIWVLVIIGVSIIMIVLLIVVFRKKLCKGRGTDAIYQEVPMHSVKKDDGGYEELGKSRAVRDGEYDTLKATSAEEKTKSERQYEALKKGDGKDEVYHTLGEEGAKAGDGG